MSGTTVFTVLRLLAGGGLLWLACQFGTRGQDPLNLPRLLIAAVAFLAAMAFLWATAFRLATKPFRLLVDLVFSPGGRLEKPILNLKLPAHYLKEGRYEEALAEYRRILRHHPDETEAWEKAIWLESRIFGRNAAAAKLERTARRRGLRPGPGSATRTVPDDRS
jgi:hypothetical protein